MASDGDVVKGPSQREQESAKSISVQTGTLHLWYYSQTEENSRGNIGSSLNHPTGRMAHNTTDDLREGKVLKFLSDTSLRLSFCLAHRDESRGSGGGGSYVISLASATGKCPISKFFFLSQFHHYCLDGVFRDTKNRILQTLMANMSHMFWML